MLQTEWTARANTKEGRNVAVLYCATLLGEGSAEGGFLTQGLRRVQLLLICWTSFSSLTLGWEWIEHDQRPSVKFEPWSFQEVFTWCCAACRISCECVFIFFCDCSSVLGAFKLPKWGKISVNIVDAKERIQGARLAAKSTVLFDSNQDEGSDQWPISKCGLRVWFKAEPRGSQLQRGGQG